MKINWSVITTAALLVLLALVLHAQQTQTSTAIAGIARFQLFEAATTHLTYRLDTQTGQAWVHVVVGASERLPGGANGWVRIDEPPAK